MTHSRGLLYFFWIFENLVVSIFFEIFKNSRCLRIFNHRKNFAVHKFDHLWRTLNFKVFHSTGISSIAKFFYVFESSDVPGGFNLVISQQKSWVGFITIIVQTFSTSQKFPSYNYQLSHANRIYRITTFTTSRNSLGGVKKYLQLFRIHLNLRKFPLLLTFLSIHNLFFSQCNPKYKFPIFGSSPQSLAPQRLMANSLCVADGWWIRAFWKKSIRPIIGLQCNISKFQV